MCVWWRDYRHQSHVSYVVHAVILHFHVLRIYVSAVIAKAINHVYVCDPFPSTAIHMSCHLVINGTDNDHGMMYRIVNMSDCCHAYVYDVGQQRIPLTYVPHLLRVWYMHWLSSYSWCDVWCDIWCDSLALFISCWYGQRLTWYSVLCMWQQRTFGMHPSLSSSCFIDILLSMMIRDCYRIVRRMYLNELLTWIAPIAVKLVTYHRYDSQQLQRPCHAFCHACSSRNNMVMV